MHDILRCPYSGSPLTEQGEHMVGEAGRYPIVSGVPWLLDPQKVSVIDRKFQEQYTEADARRYDRVVNLMALSLGAWMPAVRRRMVDLLRLKPGDRVLEISVGTGANLPFLARAVGPGGEIVALDLSVHMMVVAQERARALEAPVRFVRADAVYLPFADGSFDAVFHFGGLNMFGDVKRSLGEMVRVARGGARLVAGDEALSEARRATWLGRRLLRMNNLFGCRPPFAEVPWEQVDQFELHWALRETFYLFCFAKKGAPAEGAPTDLRSEFRRRIGDA